MTDNKIALRALLERGSDATFLREMIGFAAERLMQLETETLCGAAPGERCTDRINQRNGYRDRDWEVRAGTVELRVLKHAAATFRRFSNRAMSRTDHAKAARQEGDPEHRAAAGGASDRRGRPDACDPWRCPLAPDGSGAVVGRGARRGELGADAQP